MSSHYTQDFLHKKYAILVSILFIIALAGCNGNGTSGELVESQIQGQDVLVHPPVSIPPEDPNSPPPSPPTIPPGPSVVGTSCQPGDAQNSCIGLKYVVYKDSKGTPVVSQAEAISNLETINNIWSQCKIAFQIEEFLAVDPTQDGLVFNTANDSDLDQIRKTYDDTTHFLLVTTGKWNRAGTLGNTGANAWANMPGDILAGVVMESPVGTYPNIIAHELGHYLNLDHLGNSANLMNPIIYDTSTSLSSSQCSAAKSAIKAYWQAMLR